MGVVIRRCFAVILACFIVIVPNVSAIEVTIDNKNIEFDVSPTIHNNRVMVPMRKIFQTMGCQVEWIEDTQTVIATRNNLLMILKIDSTQIVIVDVDKRKTYNKEIDVAPIVYEERTLVPVRAISECLDCTVKWNGEKKNVIILTRKDSL